MSSILFSLLQVAGGLTLFLMGVESTATAFRSCMGRKARQKMAEVTGKKTMAFIFGVFLSALSQSSAVATSFAVGLVDVGMLSLGGSIVVMMGASVGGTFVTLLLGLPVIKIAPGILALSHFGAFFLKGKTGKVISVVKGIAFVLTGMLFLKEGVAPLMADPRLGGIVITCSDHVWLMGIISFFAAAVLQSSAAVMALAIALAGAGSLSLSAIFPIVLGSHLGSSVIVLATALNGKRCARQLGVITFFYKAIGVILSLPFVWFLPAFFEGLSGLPIEMRCVALQFLVVWFNALILLPFSGLMESLVQSFFVFPSNQIEEPVYLDKKLLEFPELYFPLLDKEITRLTSYIEREAHLLLFPEGGASELEILKSGNTELLASCTDYFESLPSSGHDKGEHESYYRISYSLGAIRNIVTVLNEGLYPLIFNKDLNDSSMCQWGDDPMVFQYREALFCVLRSALRCFAVGDFSFVEKVDQCYEKMKKMDDLIRKRLFSQWHQEEDCSLELLSKGTQLAKACVEMAKGEKLARDLHSNIEQGDKHV